MRTKVFIAFMVVLVMLSNMLTGFASKSTVSVTASSVADGKNVTVTGVVSGAKAGTQVILIVGDIDNLAFIDSKATDRYSNFQFAFEIPQNHLKKHIKYTISTDAGTEPFEDYITYSGAVVTAQATVDFYDVEIKGNVSGAASGTQVLLSIGEHDNPIFINQTETNENGDFKFNYVIDNYTAEREFKYYISTNAGSDIFEGSFYHSGDYKSVTDEYFFASFNVDIEYMQPYISLSFYGGTHKPSYVYIEDKISNKVILDCDDIDFIKSFSLDRFGPNQEYYVKIVFGDLVTFEGNINVNYIKVHVEGSAKLNKGFYDGYFVCDQLGINKKYHFTSNTKIDLTLPALVPNCLIKASIEGWTECMVNEEEYINAYNNEPLFDALMKSRPDINADKNGNITYAELSNARGSIDLSSSDITNINGLQNLTNITSLDLSNNSIENITPLERLSNLKTLDLSHNSIKSIYILPSSLKELDISHNNIGTLNGLKLLSNLETLKASNNAIFDISAIKNLKNLKYLNLAGNTLQGLNGLEHCTKLVHLDLSSNGTKNITALSNMKRLKFLDLSYNSIKDVSPLPDILYHSLNLKYNNYNPTDAVKFRAYRKLTD